MLLIEPESGRILSANQAAVDFYGYSKQQICTMGMDQLHALPPALVDIERQKAGLEGRTYFVFPQKLANGEERVVEIHESSIQFEGNQVDYLILHDITQRRLAEEQILLRNLVLNAASNALILTDPTGIIKWVNPAFSKLTGYSLDEALNKNPRELVRSGKQDESFYKNMWDTILSGQVWQGQVVNRRKDGTQYTEELTITPLRDANGSINYFIAIKEDISVRKIADDRLRESEGKFRFIAENTSDGIIVFGADSRIQYMSPAYLKQLGYRAEDEFNGGPDEVYQLIHPEDRDAIFAKIFKAIEVKAKGVIYSYRAKHKDGSYIWREDNATFYYDSGGVYGGSTVICRDITERKVTEVRIQQRVFELETLNQLSLTMRGVSAQTDILKLVMEGAFSLVNASDGLVELFNKVTGELEKVVVSGWPAQVVEPPQSIREGISYKVYTGGEIYIAHEFATDTATPAAIRASLPPGWGGVSLPIRTTHKVLGVLTVSIPSSRQLDKDEIRLLSILAEMTGAAIQRMQLFAETERRAEEFRALYETSNAIAAESDLTSLLQSIIEWAKKLLNTASSGIYLYLAQTDELVLTVETASYLPVGTRLRKGEGVAGRVAQSRQPLRINDYSTWEGRSPQYAGTIIRAVLEVPLLHQGELVGVLAVDETGSSERKFSDDDERLLSLFALQAAGAIHSSRLHEETVRRLELLQALRAVDQSISSSFDLSATLDIILRQTIAQLQADAADILLLQNNQLELVAGRGFRTLNLESLDLSTGFSMQAIQNNLPIIMIDATNEKLRSSPPIWGLWKEEGFACYWSVLLVVKGEVKGVLEVYRRKAFTPDMDWIEFLEALAGQAAIAINSSQLFENLQCANQDLSLAYEATIEGWSRAMDLRDRETEGHTLRVTDMTMKLARYMQVNESQMAAFRHGALLHDIGKMGVPDSILLKAGSLTDEEWLIMRQHPRLAREMLLPITYLKEALDIPSSHHEKWDGSGYPQGLAGEEIPLSARIFAVIDVWDALTSDRPYRKKWTNQETRQYIAAQSGRQFDPWVVKAFFETLEDD